MHKRTIISIRIEKDILDEIDRFVEKGLFISRSEAIRAGMYGLICAVRTFINKHKDDLSIPLFRSTIFSLIDDTINKKQEDTYFGGAKLSIYPYPDEAD